jgi:hypothetical protein
MAGRKGSGRDAPKVFLSYSSKDATLAGSLKKYLEYYGTEAFLAHEDIMPGEKWKAEIMKQLATCDILVPILTKEAAASPYVNQEIGYALARDVEMLPIMVSAEPFGFISETQGMKPKATLRGEIDFGTVAFHVVERILRNEITREILIRRVIDGLAGSDSFEETRCKTRILETYDEFTKSDIQTMVIAATANSQVNQCTKGMGRLKTIFRKYHRYMAPDIIDKFA